MEYGIHPLTTNGYNIILSVFLVIVSYNCSSDYILNRIGKSVIVKFFSDITLEIYCATGIGFYIFMNIVAKMGLKLSNLENIFLSSVIIILAACILKLYSNRMKIVINMIGIKVFFTVWLVVFIIVITIKSIISIQ